MIVTKTAKQKIKNYTRYFNYTVDIYREALSLVNDIVYKEWSNIATIKSTKQRAGFVEDLIHSTKSNKARYSEFDSMFYKFPTYLRRMIINQSIGYVSSFATKSTAWSKYKKGKSHKFQSNHNSFPIFYKKNMSEWVSNGRIKLKLFNGSDWIWFTTPFELIDNTRFSEKVGWLRKNPLLIFKNKRWFLYFPFEKEVSFYAKNFDKPVLGVDLGLNNVAACSVVHSNGTVSYKEFINYAKEKDHLFTLLGHIAKSSSLTKEINKDFCKHTWRKVRNISNEIAHQCSDRIVSIAKQYNCQTIVFEYLKQYKINKNKGSRKHRHKVKYWMHGRIQRFTRYKANGESIRISFVLAKGTSAYAFDGSGETSRLNNKQLAIFATGKLYNSDLSASYNVGARYWIREVFDNFKSFIRNNKVTIIDKNSVIVGRHQQTLASLISLSLVVPFSGNKTDAKLYLS